jgi:DNA polymerase-1
MYARENPARMVGLAVGDATIAGTDFYFPFRHAEGENLPEDCLEPLRELLQHRIWLGHNIPFDIKILHCDGFDIPANIWDTQYSAHLCNELEESYALKKLGAKYVGEGAADADTALKAELKARGLKGKGQMWKLPASLVAPYALQDINLTRQLHHLFNKEVTRTGQRALLEEVNAFGLSLMRIEMRGLPISPEEIDRQRATISEKTKAARDRIIEIAGFEFNVNSTQQLVPLLKLPNTRKETLEEAVKRDQNELALRILEFRACAKAESNYFAPFTEATDVNWRVHTHHKAHGTVSGRPSSSDPNAFTLAKDVIGRPYSIRSCVVAPPGYFMLECDFSTVEPRIAAHYSGDKVMKQAFFEGKDFHTATARAMYKKESIAGAERNSAKTVGLMVLYGGGSYKAARKLGIRHAPTADGGFAPCHHDVWTFQNEELVQLPCSIADKEFCTHGGRAFKQKFFDGVPELQPFLKLVAGKAEQYGYVRNPIDGRMCRFFGKRAKPFSAPNRLIQSTAAAILRRALNKLDALFRSPGDPEMVLTVYDSVCFLIPFSDKALEQVKLIKDVMENTTKISVPLKVDMKVGYDLSNMGEIHV